MPLHTDKEPLVRSELDIAWAERDAARRAFFDELTKLPMEARASIRAACISYVDTSVSLNLTLAGIKNP